MRKKKAISLDELRELLDYDRSTGIFLWKKRTGNVPESMVAGCLDRHGHRIIVVKQKKHMAHWLAWFYVYGEWPSFEIDHINMCRDDNRIENLRLVTERWQQRANQKVRSDSSSGFKGVRKTHGGSTWMVRCRKRGVEKILYGFHSPEEASMAYKKLAEELFGEFARAA
jgi:hypothetical protein